MRLAASNDAPQALDGLLAPVVTPGAISFFARRSFGDPQLVTE